ncbi:MAG: invasion associated locus B family protein [Pseudomonadota bacterium]
MNFIKLAGAGAVAFSFLASGLSAQSTEELPIGEPVEEAARPGQPYVADTFGDWQIRCVTTPERADPCQMYQLLKLASGNSVAEISIVPAPPGNAAVAGANIITPLGTLLGEQLTFTVDDLQSKRYPFTVCAQVGCMARVGFTASDLNNLQKGNRAIVRIVSAQEPDRDVLISVSLSGFTAAYDALLAAQGN